MRQMFSKLRTNNPSETSHAETTNATARMYVGRIIADGPATSRAATDCMTDAEPYATAATAAIIAISTESFPS